MEINVHELPFRKPRLRSRRPETYVIALADPDDLTVCLNEMSDQGEFWAEDGLIELRCEAILVHETLHVVLRRFIGERAYEKLDGDTYQPIDRWENDYAISRPVGVVYPGSRGFWRREW